jgi:8-oxo-dGTP diphosphatase
VPDLGRPGPPGDLDDVEAEGVRPAAELGQVAANGAAQDPPLPPVDREVARHEGRFRPGLDLDEDQDLAIAANEVDLLPPVAGTAPVARQDPEALPAQEVGRRRLAPRAGGKITIARKQVLQPGDCFHQVVGFIMATPASGPPLPYKIAVLVFLENAAGEQLLLLRAKPPNLGVWSPIGGKLEMALGESPFECAVRETHEETGLVIRPEDLHLFAMLAEKAYEGQSHWLLFLFRCQKRLPGLPPDMGEGRFGFFSRAAVDALPIPETDRTALWPIYDQYRDRFVALRADCAPGQPVRVQLEQIT